MDKLNHISVDILKDLPHILEQWWKYSLEIGKEMGSEIVKKVSVYSKPFSEFAAGYVETLRDGIHVSPVWWVVPVTFIFVITLPLYITHQKTQKRLRSLTANIPGPMTFPLLGNVPTFAGSNLKQFFQKLVKVVGKYGPVVRFWMGNKLYIVISDPESIENIFANKNLVKKNSTVSKLANGNGVVPDDGKWKIHRRIISSTFNSNVLEQFMENFSKNSFLLTEDLKSFANGTTFDIYSQICSCALDIICESTMGTHVCTQMEDNGEYKSRLLNAFETLGDTFNKPWMFNDWIHSRKQQLDQEREAAMNCLHEFVNKVIAEKKEAHRNGIRYHGSKQQVEYVQWVRGKEVTLLDLLIQDDQVTMEEIRDELSSLILAGTKVTAITCCFVLSLLGVHRDVQDKVLDEQERIFEPDISRPPTTSDVNNMKYLEQVLKETLRLYPPVPFLFRNIEEDTVLDNGYILPQGSYAVIFNFMTHRNPDYYPHPERFDPDRFSSDWITERNPYSYIPFGGGRRICVAYKFGMLEVKTILSTVLRKYQVTQTFGGVDALEKSLQAGVVLKPEDGFKIQMTPRPTKLIPSIFREE
ncbi:hypothetical protein C0J52_20869 [Blattella germanica]|nr:hypothetical protein C0J52_20869 [Blattella germanica]